MNKKLSQSLAENTVMQIVGKAIAVLIGIVTVAILLRHLGDFSYGEFTTAITFLSLFAIVVDFGLTLTTVQMISEPGAEEAKIIGNLLSLRLISGLIFFTAAPLIALLLPYSNNIKIAIAVGALGYFLSSTSQMLVGIFQKQLQMWRVVVAEILNRSVFLIGVVIITIMGAGVIETVIALILGNAVQLLVITKLSKPFVQLKTQFNPTIQKKIIKRSWPIGASIAFNLLYLRGDIIFLSLMRTQEEVGLYGGAYKIIDVLSALPVMFMGLMLPILIKAWTKGNKLDFKKSLQTTFDFFTLLAIPVAVGAFALAEPIMLLIGGEEFRGSGEVLKILAPTLAVVFFGSLYGHTIVAINKQKQMVIAYAAVAAVSIGAYFIFIPQFGMLGAAWVTLLSEALITLLTFSVVSRVSRTLPNLTVAAKSVAAAALMFAVLKVSEESNVLMQVIFGAFVYAAAIMALGAVKKETIIGLVRK